MPEIDYIVSIFDPSKEFPYRLEGFKDGEYVYRACSKDFEGALKMFSRNTGLSVDEMKERMVAVMPV